MKQMEGLVVTAELAVMEKFPMVVVQGVVAQAQVEMVVSYF